MEDSLNKVVFELLFKARLAAEEDRPVEIRAILFQLAAIEGGDKPFGVYPAMFEPAIRKLADKLAFEHQPAASMDVRAAFVDCLMAVYIPRPDWEGRGATKPRKRAYTNTGPEAQSYADSVPTEPRRYPVGGKATAYMLLNNALGFLAGDTVSKRGRVGEGKPNLADETTERLEIKLPESVKAYCLAAPEGAGAYLRRLIEADRETSRQGENGKKPTPFDEEKGNKK